MQHPVQASVRTYLRMPTAICPGPYCRHLHLKVLNRRILFRHAATLFLPESCTTCPCIQRKNPSYAGSPPERLTIINEGGDPRVGLRIAYYFSWGDDISAGKQTFIANTIMPAAVGMLSRSIRVSGSCSQLRIHQKSMKYVCFTAVLS